MTVSALPASARKLVDVKFAAEYLGLTAKTIYDLVAKRKLACVRINDGGTRVRKNGVRYRCTGAVRFLVADLDAWIDAQRVPAKTEAPQLHPRVARGPAAVLSMPGIDLDEFA